MYCKKCGSLLPDDKAGFCPSCGAPQGDGEKGKGKGGVITLVIVLVLALLGCGGFFLARYLSPELRTEKLIASGEDYLSDKDYDAAEAAFRDAIALTPDSVDAYKGLAKVYEKSDEEDELIDLLDEAYTVTGDKYFFKKLKKIDDENREEDIERAWEIMDAAFSDIEYGVLVGRGDIEVEKGTVSDIRKTYLGQGTPGRGYNFVLHYDTDADICYVSLNGFILTDYNDAQEYLDYDGPFENREEIALLPEQDPVTGVIVDPGYTVTDEEITLTMWTSSSTYGYYRSAYEAAADELAGLYPNVTLDWVVIGDDNQAYNMKLDAALAAGELPDIFFTTSGDHLGDFVESGAAYCLDDQYDAYRNDLTENILSNLTYYGELYAVPLCYNYVALYANMDILRNFGYQDIPRTYDELVECCEALKAAGITPFGCSLDEVWCVSEFLESIMIKETGADDLHRIFYGYSSWDDHGIADAVDIYRSFLDNGYFDPEGYDLWNDQIVSNFANGEYAFYVGGTWNTYLADMSRQDIVIADFPVIDQNRAYSGQYIGGPADSLAVSSRSEHPEIAAEYAFELSRLLSHYGYIDGMGLSAWTRDKDITSVDPLTQSAMQTGLEADGFVLYGDTALNFEDFLIYFDYVYAVANNAIGGGEFAAGLSWDIR